MIRDRSLGFALAAGIATAVLTIMPLRAQDGLMVRSIGAPPAPTAALLARGGEGGPLRVAATALPLSYGADRVPVLVVLELDGRSLLFGHPGGRLGLEIHVYAVAPGRRVVASISEGVAVDLARWGESLERDGLRWLARLEVAPGDYELRLHVQERQTGAFSLRAIRLLLPTPRTEGAAYLAATFPDARPWLDARSPTLGATELEAIAAAGGPPSALPVLAAGTTARVAVWAGGGELRRTAVRLTDGRGDESAPITPRLVGASTPSAGIEITTLELDLPDHSGLHDLRIEAGDTGLVSLPRRVILRPNPRGAAWHQLARVDVASARLDAAPSTLPSVRPALEARRQRLVAEGILASWRRYAGGDRESAVAAHQALEAAVVDADQRQGMGRIELAEKPLLDRVAQRSHASLLPLALFYRDLLRSHLGSGRIGLARRAEAIAEGLLIRLAAGAADAAERRLAATALESVALELIEIGAPSRAAELVRRSAELIPDRASVWVALATLHERAAELDRAAGAIDRALAIAPADREARLRNARLKDLRGERRRAAADLDRLIAEPVADWVGVVAAQERTRQLLDQGEFTSAARRLEPLVARWPAEPSLWVALAYAAERADDRATSRAAVERAAAADRAFAVAPRKLYAEPPRLALAAGRAEVETAGLLGLDALAAALAQDLSR